VVFAVDVSTSGVRDSDWEKAILDHRFLSDQQTVQRSEEPRQAPNAKIADQLPCQKERREGRNERDKTVIASQTEWRQAKVISHGLSSAGVSSGRRNVPVNGEHTTQRRSAISPVCPLAPCLRKQRRHPGHAGIPCQREAGCRVARGIRANRILQQQSRCRTFPRRSRVRRGQGETHLCCQDKAEAEREFQSSRFCKCTASIRLRSAAGSGAGEETEMQQPCGAGVIALLGRGLLRPCRAAPSGL
jgi:hypothetical protein